MASGPGVSNRATRQIVHYERAVWPSCEILRGDNMFQHPLHWYACADFVLSNAIARKSFYFVSFIYDHPVGMSIWKHFIKNRWRHLKEMIVKQKLDKMFPADWLTHLPSGAVSRLKSNTLCQRTKSLFCFVKKIFVDYKLYHLHHETWEIIVISRLLDSFTNDIKMDN